MLFTTLDRWPIAVPIVAAALALPNAGTAQNMPDAATVEAACNGGNQSACGLFGLFLASGTGVQQDRVRGLRYLEQACAAGQAKVCEHRDRLKTALAQAAPTRDPATAAATGSSENRYRPFVPTIYATYSINAVDLDTFRHSIALAGTGSLQTRASDSLEGQRGAFKRHSGDGWVAVEYDLGLYRSWDAAYDAIGRTLVSAGSAFGSNPRYEAAAANDDQTKTFKVYDVAQPRLSGSAKLSTIGRADGSVAATFYLDLRTGDKPGDRQAATPAVAATGPRLSLVDALRRLVAAAPTNFAAMRDDKTLASGRAVGTLRIVGAEDSSHSVFTTGRIRYFLPFAYALTSEDAAANLVIIVTAAKVALGQDASVETVAAPDGSKSDYIVAASSGPVILVSQSKASLGRGLNQFITVLKR